MIISALMTAIECVAQDNPMAKELATTVTAARREGAHGAFKTIKDMSLSTQTNLEALRLIVSANFTRSKLLTIFIFAHKSPRHTIRICLEISCVSPEGCLASNGDTGTV